MWSPLEYACHVRDVFPLFDERLVLMLAQDGPQYANWDQDATAVERYAEQDPVGATFTVESFARYLLHDLVHHLHHVDPTISAH